MDAPSIIAILSSAFEYTQVQSIAENDDSGHSKNVVSLNMLEKHLQNNEKEMYQLMVRGYQSLVNFLTHKKTKNVNKKWNYGITTQIKYEEYCRSFELQSTYLKVSTDLDEYLFVIHLFKKHFHKNCGKNSTEELCQEIFECSRKYFLNEDEYCRREAIKNTYNYAVQLNFPDTGATAELIGTSKYQLDFINERLKLAISVKDSFGDYINLGNKYQSLYDSEFLSGYLAGMGIENSNIDRFNNGCSFIGLYGVSCYITIVNKGVIFGRDRLILEYLKLDKRVKQLVCAILYFFKCRKLSKCKSA
ncbi:hypothetical protein HPULCUR_001743 [Helicostylum pulchrum]|uniref:Uncharacterized protein n=1 Tax=Helicostylum pulchrum TaxID=562976 RepID=A0ABP9XQK2_9FUNG